jgi:hypothetical protein
MNEYDVYAHMEATRLELVLSAKRACYEQLARGDARRAGLRPLAGGLVARLHSLFGRPTPAANPSTLSRLETPAENAPAALSCLEISATTANARRTIARAAAAAIRESRRSDESLMRGPI